MTRYLPFSVFLFAATPLIGLSGCASSPDTVDAPITDTIQAYGELSDDHSRALKDAAKARKAVRDAQEDIEDAEKDARKARKDLDKAQDTIRDARRDIERAQRDLRDADATRTRIERTYRNSLTTPDQPL